MMRGKGRLHEVVELAVDVAAHHHGAVDRLHIGLLDENLLHLKWFHRTEASTTAAHPFPRAESISTLFIPPNLQNQLIH